MFNLKYIVIVCVAINTIQTRESKVDSFEKSIRCKTYWYAEVF